MTTVPTTTTTSLPNAPKTAHEALQADLGTLVAPDTPCQERAALVLEVGWPPEELVNVLEKTLVLCREETITAADITLVETPIPTPEATDLSLKKAVADLILDKQILEEVLKGK